MIERVSNTRLLWILSATTFALALLLRIHYAAVAVVDFPLRADAQQYFRIAYNIVEHGTFSVASPEAPVIVPDSYRAPGYPAIIALFLWFFRDVDSALKAVLAAQCVLGAGVAGLSTWLASRMMPSGYAFAAGLLVAVWPHLVTLGGVALTETLFGFLLLLSACLFVRAVEIRRLPAMIAAGVACAAAALVNQIAIGLIVLCCCGLLFAKRPLAMCVFALAALGPPALWAIRDSTITPPQGLSAPSRLMENILIGMEPEFAPRYMLEGATPAAVSARERIATEMDVFAHNKTAALMHIWQRISSNPVDYMLWYVAKPARFWSWSFVQGASDIDVYPMRFAPFEQELPLRIIASVCRALNGILMFAALAGILITIAARRVVSARTSAHGIVVAVILYATFIHSILTPDVRYAAPFRSFEIVLAMFAVSAARWFGKTGALSRMRPGADE